MLSFILLTHAAVAGCPARAADLVASLNAAEAAFAAMDDAGLSRGVREAERTAGCLIERPDAAIVARMHRAEGLGAFVAGHEAGAARAFAAARALDPTFSFPPTVVPPGHPILVAYGALPTRSADTTALAAPATGRLELDTRVARSRPNDRPVLAQLVGPGETVRLSMYALPGAALFAYDEAARSIERTSRPGEPRPAAVPLAIAAGVSAASAAVLYGFAADAHDDYYALRQHDPSRGEVRQRTNALFASSVVAGALALGTGAGAVLTLGF